MKKHKKWLALLLSAVAAIGFSLCTVSCKGGEESSSSQEEVEMYFEKTDLQITLEESVDLQVVNGGEVVWSSTEETVATVDQNGKVTPLSIGETIIKATKGKEVAMCRIEVVAARAEAVLSLTLNKQTLSLFAGDTFPLSAEVKNGSNAVEGTLVWTSDDEAIASVSQTGVVTALKAGKTNVTAAAEYSGERVEKTISVTVLEVEPILAVALSDSQVMKGAAIELAATVVQGKTVLENPESVTYELSDGALARVDNNRLIGQAKGNVILTARCEYEGEPLETSVAVRVREEYTVEYLNDGITVETKTVLDGENVIQISDPLHDKTVFEGWYYNGEKYDFSLPVQENVTLHAKWRPYALAENGTAVVSSKSNLIENGLWFNIGELGAVEWIITLDTLDYSAYKSVTYRFTGNAAWMNLGFIDGDRIKDSCNDSRPFDGTIKVVNNGEGNYTVEIHDTVTGNTVTASLTDEDVISGKKGFAFAVNNGARYRTLHVGPAIIEK